MAHPTLEREVNPTLASGTILCDGLFPSAWLAVWPFAMNEFIDRLHTGLARLRAADPEGQLALGAGRHRYRLHEPVEEQRVASFERRYGISLPPDYRAFIIHAGNGGAGPCHGVFRLGEVDDGYGLDVWRPGVFVGRVQGRFHHVGSSQLARSEGARQLGPAETASIDRYWTPVDGALPICHHGCALRDWLVVSGPEAGRVWHDGRVDLMGWTPLLDDRGAPMTFEAWYLAWLDRTLNSVCGP